jgi:hypothetical protein
VQGNTAAAHLGQVALAEQHRATAGAFTEVDELEQRALAGAGMAGDEEHLARGDFETHVGQCVVTAVVAFADVVEAQDGHSVRKCSQFSGKYRGRTRRWLVVGGDRR